MKVRLNKLPVKTTNHFHINDIELEIEEPIYQGQNELSFLGDISNLIIKEEIKEERLETKIGLPITKYKECVITIPKDTKVENPILIDYIFRNKDSFIDKITFHYEENAQCDFIITYLSADEENHFHYLLEKSTFEKNAKGSITYMNMLNRISTNLISIENDVLEDATSNHNIFDIGGKTRLYNVSSNLLEKGAKNTLNTIYIGKENDIIDINYYLKNIEVETENKMQVEGVLKDSSQKNFRGTIDFIKGCLNAIGEEQENCVLLSENARSRSLPQLLCGEENVVGTHGVSSGQVSKEKLFYLMSRGYDKKEAEQLIIMTNFHKILKEVPSEEVQKFLEKNIEEILTK